MAVLLTGGTGKTSIRVARFLQNGNVPYVLASRRGQSAAPPDMPAVKFDWLDKDTWRIPFDYKQVDYYVLWLSWFMGKIYTACGQGKIPFISAMDIAAVAYRALTDPVSHNCDHWVLGPELLMYNNIADKLSRVLGRTIEHVKLLGEEWYQGLVNVGVSEYYTGFLTKLEVAALTGFETRENDEVKKVTGRPLRCFDLFAQENQLAWVPEDK
ncbi:hypothetical protein KXX35_009792 [Aspergillus fumigatus]|nr:hypothetical protein KXX20_000581 [Aspergillus fumigatus]KAH1823472.1 hypothetical protein KXX35_009792 [Aspergillus fumigatus]KAH2265872.1 hypothetical protein KXW96_000520 [Aspergillus fumigatus]